jgi:hypothetical protein
VWGMATGPFLRKARRTSRIFSHQTQAGCPPGGKIDRSLLGRILTRAASNSRRHSPSSNKVAFNSRTASGDGTPCPARTSAGRTDEAGLDAGPIASSSVTERREGRAFDSAVGAAFWRRNGNAGISSSTLNGAAGRWGIGTSTTLGNSGVGRAERNEGNKSISAKLLSRPAGRPSWLSPERAPPLKRGAGAGADTSASRPIACTWRTPCSRRIC